VCDPVQNVGGDVAQVFRTDAEWAEALAAVRGALRPGGSFLFETRGPARRAWLGWTRERRSARRDILASDRSRCGATCWMSRSRWPLSSGPTASRQPGILPDGEVVTSVWTLRFYERDEIEAWLNAAGFEVDEVLDAPDRAGLEWVFVARPALARGQEMPRMKVRMSSASSFGSSIAGK
jgi:hypothetical protein